MTNKIIQILRSFDRDSFYLLILSKIKNLASAINIQTLLTGVGGGCGYLLAGLLGMEGRIELYFIAVSAFLISLFLTLTSFKERQYRKKSGKLQISSTNHFSDPPIPSGTSRKNLGKSQIEVVRCSSDKVAKKSVTFLSKMEEFKSNINQKSDVKHKTTQSEQHIRKKYQVPITMARGFAMTTTRWQSGSVYKLNDSNSMPAGLDKGTVSFHAT